MYYFSESQPGFLIGSINKTLPKDAIKLTEQQYQNLLIKQVEGFEVKVVDGVVLSLIPPQDQEYLKLSERFWRDLEIKRADIELYKVQDSDSKCFGSVSDWRNYRKSLRSWPEQPNFPNKEFRPVAPDA